MDRTEVKLSLHLLYLYTSNCCFKQSQACLLNILSLLQSVFLSNTASQIHIHQHLFVTDNLLFLHREGAHDRCEEVAPVMQNAHQSYEKHCSDCGLKLCQVMDILSPLRHIRHLSCFVQFRGLPFQMDGCNDLLLFPDEL